MTTGAADPVGETTATLNASITNPDGVNITAKGFEYTSDGTNWSPVAGTGDDNSFTANLTGLTSNTTYTYKCTQATVRASSVSRGRAGQTESGTRKGTWVVEACVVRHFQ